MTKLLTAHLDWSLLINEWRQDGVLGVYGAYGSNDHVDDRLPDGLVVLVRAGTQTLRVMNSATSLACDFRADVPTKLEPECDLHVMFVHGETDPPGVLERIAAGVEAAYDRPLDDQPLGVLRAGLAEAEARVERLRDRVAQLV